LESSPRQEAKSKNEKIKVRMRISEGASYNKSGALGPFANVLERALA
jgi:hypothetical protein